MTHGRAVIRVNPSGGITSSNSRCTRRHLVSMLLAAGGIATGCRRQTTDLGSRCDAALISALRALIAAQSPDGSWRSQTYGAFKDGLALTPLVLKTLVFGPPIAASETARMSGASFLSNLVRPDGSIDSGPYGLGFPVYTSAGAAIVLSRINGAGNRTACDAWLEQLRSRQLTEELGWSPADLAYGGWGDSLAPSVKLVPSEGPPARAPSADLSSTLFAIGALRLAGTGNDDVAVRKARSFVESCQNFADDDREADAAYDDGGFFFSPVELTRNKAGAAGSDLRVRYHSYGSTSADGLRALLRCGLPLDSPRVRAARAWLEHNFSAAENPGAFEPAREVERASLYYYYCWSAAHAFRALGLRAISTRDGEVFWAEQLARELINRQRADGTWVNEYSASKEDDPLVATALAVGALALCRVMMPR